MTVATPTSDERVVHGFVFVILLALTFSISALRAWPWIWLAPLTAYFLIVAGTPRLRRSFVWLRAGRITPMALAATIGAMTLTIGALLLFQKLVRPDLQNFRAAFPFASLGGVVRAGIIFSVANATIEELIFRGILFDALDSQWGKRATVVMTALLFGLGHLRGYPSGLTGAGLATLFGFAMGLLRLWTGGLALPILAHISADATIYCIVMRDGAV